jgi:uncharacterized membrane protein YfcA
MEMENLVGAAAGRVLAGSAPAEMLKLLLGFVLIVRALKVFWAPPPF